MCSQLMFLTLLKVESHNRLKVRLQYIETQEWPENNGCNTDKKQKLRRVGFEPTPLSRLRVGMVIHEMEPQPERSALDRSAIFPANV